MTKPALAISRNGRVYPWPPPPAEAEYECTSVTTVLREMAKPALVPWASKAVATFAVENKSDWIDLDDAAAIDMLKRAPRRDTSRKADRGSAVHDILEQYARLGSDAVLEAVDPEAIPFALAGMTFMDRFVAEPLHVEATVFHTTLGYAGTADLFARLKDGRVAVIDWKTSKGVYAETALQLTAYARGRFIGTVEGYTHPVPQCDVGIVVHLRPNGTYAVHTCDVQDRALWETWKALCVVSRFSRGVAPTALVKKFEGDHSPRSESAA